MRTNNRPSYCIVFRKRGGYTHMHGPYDTREEAETKARQWVTSSEVAEVCELTTVYEVKP